IAEDYIDKIFDPFFTTKSPGKGTGLGLSICQRIINEFDGRISVESEVGKGTRFEIIFTCVQN
ncbi:MAG: sensor histidine kinase, partial [Thermodesulfobacteriota bacterium]